MVERFIVELEAIQEKVGNMEMDKKIKEIKMLQAELDRRMELEAEVVSLVEQCRFQEADELMDRMDRDYNRDFTNTL